MITVDGPGTADLGIENGRIVGIGEVGAAAQGAAQGAAQEVDASGCLIGPGFVDIHVHFREPGQTWKEDIETGSRAAAAGGFTAVVPMANTAPATDTVDLVRAVTGRGSEVGLVDLAPAAALTLGRKGKTVSPIEALWEAGVRIFSDDGDSVADTAVLEEAMERVAAVGGVVAQHAEDAAMTVNGHMHEGTVSRRLGIGGLPAAAEVEVVARDLELAVRSGVRYHVQHASTAGTVSLIRSTGPKMPNLTAEAAPHHFSLDHESVEDGGTVMKMYPPLRTHDDVLAVADAVRDGTIGVVATDHAPHSAAEKAVPFEDAPRGIIGLETSAPLTWSVLHHDTRVFFERMSVAPARIAGLEDHGRWPEIGRLANLVVFDPRESWTPTRFASKSQNSPWLGRLLEGRIRATIRRGVLTYERAR